MSKKAIEFLFECDLLKSNGDIVDLSKCTNSDISRRIIKYNQLRKDYANYEIETYQYNEKLSAQYSVGSSRFDTKKSLSSLLVYDRIVLNDPLVSSRNSISLEDLNLGVRFFSELYHLIKNDLVFVYPIEYLDKPDNEVPLWFSEDSFKSSILPLVHDFAHENAVLKSVFRNEKGEMLISSEDAYVKKRTALNVDFKDDTLYSGVSLFLFKTIEDAVTGDDGFLRMKQVWDPQGILPKEKFEAWSYQAVNQAIIARIKTIGNQSLLASKIGSTYITESKFESKLLSLAKCENAEEISPCVQFLNLNDRFVNVDSPYTLIKIRKKHRVAFDRFNESLIAISCELSGTSPEEFARKSKILFQKEILPQVDEVKRLVDQMSSSILKGSLLSLGTIAFGITTGSTIPVIPSILYMAASGNRSYTRNKRI